MIRWLGFAAGIVILAGLAFLFFGRGGPQAGVVTPGVAEMAIPTAPARADLTIYGAIGRSNASRDDAPALMLDMAMLRALPQRDIKTTTSWTDREGRFTGPLLRDVVAFAGGGGDKFVATAVNDYFVTIPAADATRYDVILAHSMDDEPLKRSDKGPLWVVYPESDHPELRDPLYNGRWIWQLKSIEIR